MLFAFDDSREAYIQIISKPYFEKIKIIYVAKFFIILEHTILNFKYTDLK